MRNFLLYPDRNFELNAPLPKSAEAVVRDLELATLFDAMARGDGFLRDVARRVVVAGLSDVAEVEYRQAILRDALDHPALVRELYQIAVAALETEHSVYRPYSRSPESVLRRAAQALEELRPHLEHLRRVAGGPVSDFRSEGFRRFFSTLREELSDSFFVELANHLETVRFPRGILLSAGLGVGLKGRQYVLRTPRERRPSWLRRVFGPRRPANSFELDDRDEAGHRMLSELVDRGIDPVANAFAQSVDHVVAFFTQLATEAGFFTGALNLQEDLARRGVPTTVPEVRPAEARALTARALYDICLALRLTRPVVTNDLAADGRKLVVITGANQGGKSTFLRSVGVAQMMAEAGLFVGARSLSTSVSHGVFTHFKREEDASMQRGKLEEELHRMSELVDRLHPASLLLCNESFASTNEREGSEIARQALAGFRAAGVRVYFVTFLTDLAEGYVREGSPEVLFLRAERREDGARTYRMIEAGPLRTGFGGDLYTEVFPPVPAGPAPDRPSGASPEVASPGSTSSS